MSHNQLGEELARVNVELDQVMDRLNTTLVGRRGDRERASTLRRLADTIQAALDHPESDAHRLRAVAAIEEERQEADARRHFALIGWKSEDELVDLAYTDPVAAVCAPNTTKAVIDVACKEIYIDPRSGEVAAILNNGERVVVGRIDVTSDDIAGQVHRVIPCGEVIATHVTVNRDTGEVGTAGGWYPKHIGTVKRGEDPCRAAEKMLADLCLLTPGERLVWRERSFGWAALLDVYVASDTPERLVALCGGSEEQ
jgi:hypothetical protein